MRRILISSILLLILSYPIPPSVLGQQNNRMKNSVSPRLLSNSPHRQLKKDIDMAIVDSLFPPSNIGIKIVSLTRGDVLYELNSDMLFNPASNQKLFTTAGALRILGSGYRFSTVVSIDSSSRRIYLKGFGDPQLTTKELDSIAGRTSFLLPAGKPWTVVGDISFFDDEILGAGWTWDAEPSTYGAFITPLILNGNALRVTARPGLMPGDPVIVEQDPVNSFMSVQNSGITVGETANQPLVISRNWRDRTNVITIKGELDRKAWSKETTLSIWQPERFALSVFADRLRAYGVSVSGMSIDTLSSNSVEVFRHSRPLDSVITVTNKVSDNLSAEAILKTIAAETAGAPGSAKRGISALNLFLDTLGVDTLKIVMVDGSGLSRYNLTTPSVIVRLLETMYKDSVNFRSFYYSLPIAGVDGTIGGRMKDSKATGNLRAKTGTLSAVSALSGYVRTTDDELLAFSVLTQNFAGSSKSYRMVQDKIGDILSNFKRSGQKK